MKCANCGTEFDEGIFCPECGTKYNEEEAIAAEAMRIEEEERKRLEIEKEKAEQERLKKEEEAKEKLAQKNKNVANACGIISFILCLFSMPCPCCLGLNFFGGNIDEDSVILGLIWAVTIVVPSIILSIIAIKRKAQSMTLAKTSLMLVGISIVLIVTTLIFGADNYVDQNITSNDRNDEITTEDSVGDTEQVSDNSIETQESDDIEDENDSVTTSQTTTMVVTTTNTTTTTTVETTTQPADNQNDYIKYLEWNGYYGGGWVDTGIEIQIDNKVESDGFCGYLTEEFRGMTSKYGLYYNEGGYFVANYIEDGSNALWCYIYFEENEEGQKIITLYDEESGNEDVFIKDAEITYGY